ncbi:hypothetical protein BU17DRAFT_67958 [Hysterangium stoloniferum]|nr:hypothetical protein BU17DRAFT_67958 [Hysterangium stoloniferum]
MSDHGAIMADIQPQFESFLPLLERDKILRKLFDRVHRARYLASKRMAATSTTGMNEIRISSSMAASDSSSTLFSKQDTPPNTPNTADRVAQETNDIPYEQPIGLGSSFGGGLGFRGSKYETPKQPYETTDLLRTSEKSMADYFSEKILLKTTQSQGRQISYS